MPKCDDSSCGAEKSGCGCWMEIETKTEVDVLRARIKELEDDNERLTKTMGGGGWVCLRCGHSWGNGTRKIDRCCACISRKRAETAEAKVKELENDLKDFQMVIGHCVTIYDHVTNGRVSKANTLPEVVIEIADECEEERWAERCEEQNQDLRKELENVRCRAHHYKAEFALAEKALVDLRDHGTRHDLTPTICVSREEGAMREWWHDYIRRMDEHVRWVAKEALTNPPRGEYANLEKECDRLADELLKVAGEADPPVCRQQFPDGSVPGNAKEAAEGWKNEYDKLKSAGRNKSDWCPLCRQGWDCAKQDQQSRQKIHEQREALKPVWDWYNHDEHPDRDVADVIKDVVADLQKDRWAVLAFSKKTAEMEALLKAINRR